MVQIIGIIIGKARQKRGPAQHERDRARAIAHRAALSSQNKNPTVPVETTKAASASSTSSQQSPDAAAGSLKEAPPQPPPATPTITGASAVFCSKAASAEPPQPSGGATIHEVTDEINPEPASLTYDDFRHFCVELKQEDNRRNEEKLQDGTRLV